MISLRMGIVLVSDRNFAGSDTTRPRLLAERGASSVPSRTLPYGFMSSKNFFTPSKKLVFFGE